MEDIKQTLWVIVKTMCECESKIPEHCTKFNAIYSIVSFAVAQERERIAEELKKIGATCPEAFGFEGRDTFPNCGECIICNLINNN